MKTRRPTLVDMVTCRGEMRLKASDASSEETDLRTEYLTECVPVTQLIHEARRRRVEHWGVVL